MEHLDFDHLHHAYCITGNVAGGLKEVLDFLRSHDIELSGNPFLSILEFERFGIADARELQQLQQGKAPDGIKKFFIISTFSITLEAQHALLKLLEEPTLATHIFLIVPDEGGLLATLRSRLHQITIQSSLERTALDPDSFLSQSPAERMKIVEEVIKDHRSGKVTKETRRVFSRHDAIIFLNGIEERLYAEMKSRPQSERDYPEIFREISRMRTYAHNPGSSLKIILEYMVLLV